MAGLGDTTAALARIRRAAAKAAAEARPSGPGHLVETAFAPNPGRLRMLSFAPEGVENPPLVVVLHGCSQTAAGYAVGAGWQALAEHYGFALLCPEQQAGNNANRCFNWFEPAHTRHDAGEAASIRAMIEQALENYGIDRERIFITGLSAGGAMAGAMLAAYPEVFAGGAIVAGLPYGSADGMHEAFGAMMQPRAHSTAHWGQLVRNAPAAQPKAWPAIAIWHGGSDSTVNAANAEELVKQWRDVHGLTHAAAEADTPARGCNRRTWRDKQGVALVRSYILPGFGHGAPLATGGPEGVGAAGPFLMEAGVSSSLEIARDWGLAPPDANPAVHHEPATHASQPSLTSEIEDVIRKALAAAGLIG